MKNGTIPTINNASGSSLQYPITISYYYNNEKYDKYMDIDCGGYVKLSQSIAVPVTVTFTYKHCEYKTTQYTKNILVSNPAVTSEGSPTAGETTIETVTRTIAAGETYTEWSDSKGSSNSSWKWYSALMKKRTKTADAKWIISIAISISGSYYQIYRNGTAYKNYSTTLVSGISQIAEGSSSISLTYSKIKRLSGE